MDKDKLRIYEPDGSYAEFDRHTFYHRRTEQVSVSLNEEEMGWIRRRAVKFGTTVTDYMRKISLDLAGRLLVRN